MPDAYGQPTEEELRQRAGVAPPSQIPSPMNGWNGTIGGTNFYFGALPSTATQQEAESYYRNDPAYQRSAAGGYLKPEAYRALNPNASTADLAAYDKFYQRQEYLRTRPVNRGFGSNPLTTIAAMIGAAAGGAALAGWGGGAAGSSAAGGAAGGSTGLGATVGEAAGGTFGGGTLAGAGTGTGALSTGGAGGLGIFANGGVGGLAGVGGGNAGALAASGGISGGAGTGFLGSTGSSGLLANGGSQLTGYVRDANSLYGALNGSSGANTGGGAVPYAMPNLSGMLGSQMPQQQMSPQFFGLPTQLPMPYIPARGYNVHDFYGAKVWT